MRRIMRLLRTVISILLILTGITFLAAPKVNEVIYRRETVRYIRKFKKDHKEKKKKEEDPLYQEIVRYNRANYENGQADFRDAWSQEQAPMKLNTEDERFGYIEVPSAGIKLPLYLGASLPTLRKGAAILGGTSIPIGMKNTNSVIAGHRGYHGIPYFRNIEAIKRGDAVHVTNPWEKLTYKVVDIDVIDPYDVDKVKIREGKDMITLMTCHPYRSGGKYRYLVYCQRVEEGEPEPEIYGDDGMTVNYIPSTPDIKREDNFRAFAAALIAVMIAYRVIMELLSFSRKKKSKNPY